MEASILALLSCLASGPDPAFLDQHDPIWEVPPVEWKTGIPLANGHIGALVWGDGNPLKITLDTYDAWETREKPLNGLTYAKLREMVRDGRKEEAENCMRTDFIYGKDAYPTRLPLPRVEVDFGKPFDPAGYKARLHLRHASASIEDASRQNRFPAMSITTPMGDNVVLVSYVDQSSMVPGIRVGFDHLNPDAREMLRRWGYPEPEISSSENEGVLRQRTPSGYEYAVAWKRAPQVYEGNRPKIRWMTLAIAVVSTNDAEDPGAAAREKVEKWTSTPLNLSAHQAWWDDFWSRSWLTIPDARLESLYYTELYKLGCSSVPGGYPVTLQGLWTLDGGLPPWSGDYHLDMNVQQSYWPIYAANRLDLGEPLYRVFSECIPRWRQQCQEFFGFDGVWAGCAIGPKGERIYGYSGVELWPGNAPWLAHHYWLHWLYSQDKQFLRDQALPMIRLCFLTYANLLEKGDDGKLHVPLSYSPEYHEGGFKSYAPDPTCDLALIRMLGQAILDANKALGAEDELTPRVNDVLTNLVDYPQRDNRVWISGDQPMERSHRHHSQLMMLHPLAVVTPDAGEAQRKLVQGSMHQLRGLGTGQWTGWSFPWMSLLASRAGYPNWAWQMLDTYANSFITPNTFHINGDPRVFGLSLHTYDPMTLEAGFGAAAAIQEMLLQSQGGLIRVFPSMPDRWHDACFENLRAEGAFLVSAKLVDGALQWVRVTSEAGGRCRIDNAFGAPVLLANAEQKSTELSGDLLEFDTEPGQSYLLYAAAAESAPPDQAPSAFTRSDDELNFYGIKRLPRF